MEFEDEPLTVAELAAVGLAIESLRRRYGLPVYTGKYYNKLDKCKVCPIATSGCSSAALLILFTHQQIIWVT